MKRLIVIICALITGVRAMSQDLIFQKHCVDSIAAQIANQPDDSTKVDLLFQKAYHQYWLDTTAANATVLEAAKMATRLLYRHGQFQEMYILGNFAEYRKDYTDALFYYGAAEGIAVREHLSGDLHDAYASQLNLRFYRGEYVYALEVCHRGLRLAEDESDKKRQANYISLEGFIYRNMRQDKNAEGSFRKFLRLSEELNDTLEMANAHAEMAQVMIVLGIPDSSLFHLKRADHYYKFTNQRHRFAFVEYLRTRTFLKNGLYDSAAASAERCIAKSGFVPSNTYDLARYYNVAGESYLRTNQNRLAIFWLQLAAEISLSDGHRENERDSYALLAEAYQAIGQTDSAFYYLKHYQLLQDSLINEQNLRTIAEMNALYQLESAQRDLLAMQLAEYEKTRRTKLLVGIGVLSILVLFLFYNRYRLKQKTELQLTINQQQNQMFQEILSAQEKERQRIAGDLHDGLGSLLSTAKLQLQLMGDSDLTAEQKKHYEAALDLVNRSSQDLRSISHSIMPASLKKLGLTAALESVIAGLNVAGQIQFHLQSHHMESRIEEEKELALYNISMELINNAAKHSGAKNVMIQFVRHENILSLTIEDDGKGFDPEKSADGIGLSNIRKRVDYFRGNIEIDSKPGGPTTISIEVPVS